MGKIDEEFGELNPLAPVELSRFAFLIGRWRCEAKIRSASGEWKRYDAVWLGRYVLNGYAIEDEYRMTDDGELVVLGMNLRTYDVARQSWNIRWLNALDGSWTNLVSEELGGMKVDDASVSYSFKEPVVGHAYTRATYTNHSSTYFTWRGEKAKDGKSWSDFMVVDAYRG